MNKGKLYELLGQMTGKERKDFHHYLTSPLFTNSEDLGRILSLYIDHILSVDRPPIDRKTFNTLVYPNRKDTGNYLSLRLTRLGKELRNFLSITYARDNTLLQATSGLRELNERQCNKSYISFRKSILKKLPLLPRDQDWYRSQIELEAQENLFLTRNPLLDEKGLRNLPGVFTSMNSYLILENLVYGCAAVNLLAVNKGGTGQPGANSIDSTSWSPPNQESQWSQR